MPSIIGYFNNVSHDKNFVMIQVICSLNFILCHLFDYLIIIFGYAVSRVLICDIHLLCQFDVVIPSYRFFVMPFTHLLSNYI